MNLKELKRIIPNSDNWISAEEITFGWSGEQKYKIKTTNNKYLLLRILSKEQFKEQENGIKFLNKCSKKSKYVPHILNKGYTLDNTKYYLLLNYIIGNNGMSEIETLSKDEQYILGFKMGEIIKNLHSISNAQINQNYIKTFKEKIDKFIAFYLDNKANFKYLHNIEEYLLKLKKIIEERPVIMLHNDFHLGNMVINNEDISLIDFNRTTLGDNIKEFDAIAWSATHSEHFTTGLLDSYLKNINKKEFFEILRYYISLWEVQMLSFIQNEDEEEKRTVINLIKYTEGWFDNSTIPSWYLKNTKEKL